MRRQLPFGSAIAGLLLAVLLLPACGKSATTAATVATTTTSAAPEKAAIPTNFCSLISGVEVTAAVGRSESWALAQDWSKAEVAPDDYYLYSPLGFPGPGCAFTPGGIEATHERDSYVTYNNATNAEELDGLIDYQKSPKAHTLPLGDGGYYLDDGGAGVTSIDFHIGKHWYEVDSTVRTHGDVQDLSSQQVTEDIAASAAASQRVAALLAQRLQ